MRKIKMVFNIFLCQIEAKTFISNSVLTNHSLVFKRVWSNIVHLLFTLYLTNTYIDTNENNKNKYVKLVVHVSKYNLNSITT